MLTFNELLEQKKTFKHHALLLLSQLFSQQGIPDEEFKMLAHSFCGMDFYDSPNSTSFEMAKGHPDVFVADRERKVLRLEDIKAIRTFCLYPPQQSTKRLFVIENCERLNINAANSLLKVLEEPPTSCLFVLTSSKLSLVLPTIASRMQKVMVSFGQEAAPAIETAFNPEDVKWLAHKISQFKQENYLLHVSLNEKNSSLIKSSQLKDIILHCDKYSKEYEVENLRALLITLIRAQVKENKSFIHCAKFALATLSEWKNFQDYHPSTSLWLIRFFLAFL